MENSISSRVIGIIFVSLMLRTIVARQEELHYLERNSFELTAKITKKFSSTEQYVNQVNEKYSADQRRAKIRVEGYLEDVSNGNPERTAARSTEGTYFVDIADGLNLYYQSDLKLCYLVERTSVRDALKLSYIQPLSMMTPDSHVVGVANLFVAIGVIKRSLKLSNDSIEVRNIRSKEYTYISAKYADSDIIYLYYNADDDLNDIKTTPIRLTFVNKALSLIYDFSPIKLLQVDTYTSEHLNRQVQDSQAALDEFVLLPFSSCWETLSSYRGQNIFAKRTSDDGSLPPVRFSFVADVKQQRIPEFVRDSTNNEKRLLEFKPNQFKTFVAYDENLQSLRVDTLESDLPSAPDRLLYYFKLNRVYNLRHREAKQQVGNNPINIDDKEKRGECVVGQIWPENTEVSIGLSHLLTGVIGSSFVLLGKAQVRGIEALVYEVAGSPDLPFWLEPTMSRDAIRATETPTTMLYYFGQRESEQPLLLMIEIFDHYSKQRSGWLRKQTIEVYDFKWDLDAIAPINGDRPAEMFSLRDNCPDKEKPSNVNFELIIEKETPDNEISASWMSTSIPRNQAIVAGLCESLDISTSNIFDVRSRVLKSPTEPNKLSIVIDFWHNRHSLSGKKLIAVGQAEIKSSASLETLVVGSFRDCFLLAALSEDEIYFAFDRRSYLCLLDRQTPVRQQDSKDPHCFKLTNSGRLRVYRTLHDFGYIESSIVWWSDDCHIHAISLQGKSIKLGYIEPRTERLDFRIKRFQRKSIDDCPNEVPVSTDKTKDKHLNEPSSRIRGYGLSLDDIQHNKLMDSMEVDSSLIDPYTTIDGGQPEMQTEPRKHKFEMTLSQCHSICMSNLECQSYSLCMINYRLQCVVSKLSLKSADVLRQLEPFNKSRSGQVVSILANNIKLKQTEPIKLVKRVACTIYNKRFLDFFEKPHKKSHCFIYPPDYEPVESLDECAAKCALLNFQVAGNGLAGKSRQHLAELQTRNTSRQGGPVDTRWAWNVHVVDRMCWFFTYISSSQAMLLPDNTRKALLSMNASDAIDGYCETAKSEAVRLANFDMSVQQTLGDVPLEYHGFNIVNMYEEQPGFALKPSQLTPSEMDAIVRVRTNHLASLDQVQLAMAIVQRGENIQLTGYGFPSKCAELCFKQLSNPWPACRSFDVVVEKTRNNQTAMICRFNSVTLKQLSTSKRYQLIENGTDAQSIRHYEPRLGLAVDSLNIFAANLEVDRLVQSTDTINYESRFTLFCVILVAFVSGLSVGLIIYRKYLSGFRLSHSTIQRTDSVLQLVVEKNQNQPEIES